MRCWTGYEHENNGYLGSYTLFVEDTNPDLDIVKALATTHNVQNIYLGAGEVDIKEINGDIESLINIGFTVLLESSMDNDSLSSINLSVFSAVILRSRLFENLHDNCIVKIRNVNDVRLIPYKEFKSNSITSVVDGQYADDIEVYNR